jgi:hypothetical protein
MFSDLVCGLYLRRIMGRSRGTVVAAALRGREDDALVTKDLD